MAGSYLVGRLGEGSRKKNNYLVATLKLRLKYKHTFPLTCLQAIKPYTRTSRFFSVFFCTFKLNIMHLYEVYNQWAKCPDCGKQVLCRVYQRTEYPLKRKLIIKYECEQLHRFTKNFKLPKQ